MSGRNKLAESLLAAAQQKGLCPPADLVLIADIERRFGVAMPTDMAALYRFMNGMRWPTKPENGWLRLWEMDSWCRVRDEPTLQDAKYSAVADAIIVADHCDESWWYAAHFEPTGSGPKMLLVDGLRSPKLVAENFTEFVRAALADSAEIYPSEPSAG
jgi:hypothetical protein